MAKAYVKDTTILNDEELRTGKISYRRLIHRWINNLILCNKIADIDESIWDNMSPLIYDDEEDEYTEIYQYFICDIDGYGMEKLRTVNDEIFSYSNMLDKPILCVTHWGTSWDYVMTDVEWTNKYDEVNYSDDDFSL